jgi:hypothetical protein
MRKINVDPGAFPYRVIDGPEESRYLTWVRNHSNYLARRGFVDYMRIVAILVRGILINFATLLPVLMVASVLVAWTYGGMLRDWRAQIVVETAQAEAARSAAEAANAETGAADSEAKEAAGPGFFFTRPVSAESSSWVRAVQQNAHTAAPFVLTPLVVLLTLAYYMLFPVVIRLFKVISQKKSLLTGRESSVKQRDVYERTFGGLLIAILGVAAIEALPLLLHYFHTIPQAGGWRNGISALIGGSALMALSGAGKLISKLGGPVKKKIAVILVGLLGLVLPLLVVLHLGEYMVYSHGEPFSLPLAALFVIPGLLLLGSFLAVVFGWKKVSGRELRWLLWLFLCVALAVVVLYLGSTLIDAPWKLVLLLAAEVWAFCFLAVDVNLTSVLGLYRDRLATAYLVGEDTSGDVDIEEDIDLHEICLHEALSVAPYHLVNVTHNLQASKDISIRERNSDFFIFSKRFCGSARTGYCQSETLERVFPQMDLATAMAISAAAAAPNMGANTSRGLVALLTMLNIRLGYWVPNPGRLAGDLAERDLGIGDADERSRALAEWAKALPAEGYPDLAAVEERLGAMVEAKDQPAAVRLAERNLGFSFAEVFAAELREVRARWENAYDDPGKVRDQHHASTPSPEHGLVGMGCSGGGIRSATIAMGVAQALDRAGVLDHVDYLSSVSGGGYFASSVSTLMRARTPLHSEIDGAAAVVAKDGFTVVEVQGGKDDRETREYKFRSTATLSDAVKSGRVRKGDELTTNPVSRAGLIERFAWRVPPRALWRETLSRLDETSKWINLSDGGHIENLAAIELLRRRCRFIIISDGGADPKMFFGSLATLIRYARIDLGIEIEIDLEALRLHDPPEDSARAQRPLVSRRSFAVGRINYPNETTPGHLLYFKSSCLGTEEEIIQQYRNTHGDFPHESTADQFFDEGQFEAYRALGYYIASTALKSAPGAAARDHFTPGFARDRHVTSFFEEWFDNLEQTGKENWAPSPVEAQSALDAGAKPEGERSA